MKVVLDTNVLFSAFFFPGGMCDKVFRACVLRHQLFVSEHILGELTRHLSGKASFDLVAVDATVLELRTFAVCVEPSMLPPGACRDPNDIAILGTALAASADVIVTGDKDLLVLGTFQAIPIVTPRQFSDQFLVGPPLPPH